MYNVMNNNRMQLDFRLKSVNFIAVIKRSQWAINHTINKAEYVFLASGRTYTEAEEQGLIEWRMMPTMMMDTFTLPTIVPIEQIKIID